MEELLTGYLGSRSQHLELSKGLFPCQVDQTGPPTFNFRFCLKMFLLFVDHFDAQIPNFIKIFQTFTERKFVSNLNRYFTGQLSICHRRRFKRFFSWIFLTVWGRAASKCFSAVIIIGPSCQTLFLFRIQHWKYHASVFSTSWVISC